MSHMVYVCVVNNAIDTFDALLRKNIYGLKKMHF